MYANNVDNRDITPWEWGDALFPFSTFVISLPATWKRVCKTEFSDSSSSCAKKQENIVLYSAVKSFTEIDIPVKVSMAHF